MEPLKNLISNELIDQYAKATKQAYPSFDTTLFVSLILDQEWENRELMDRMRHIAHTYHKVLNLPFEEAIEIIETVAKHMPTGFEYLIAPFFVQFYGLDHFDRSMKAMELLTRFSTCEFAIRPFIKKYPKETMLQMLEWTKHENEHVRRLASEGCRPRLPWGGNLPNFIENPEMILPILTYLRKDPALYVRKSVANNLNDISKDHPKLVLKMAEHWLSEGNKEVNWIVKHALRTLLKQPHPKALQLFGYADPTHILLDDFQLKYDRVPLEGDQYFTFNIKNQAKQSAKLRLEYIVHFQKKKGTSPKVFQIAELELGANESRAYDRKQSFKELTTRKHYPGIHAIELRVNGVVKAVNEFELIFPAN